MPRGHSLSIYARFSGKKRTSLYISREKVITRISLLHPNTAQRSFFPLNNLSLGKLKKKNRPEKPAYILMRVYRIVLMPPGDPIVLLKSN